MGMPQTPHETDAPPDPRTVSEDVVVAWIEAATEFEKATMLAMLSQHGWTCERAHHVRQRAWRTR